MMDRPLRFCMITTFYPPYNFGGDGIFVQRLSHELAQHGHHVEVIHCLDSYLLLAGREPQGTYQHHPNVTVHGLRSPFGFLSPLATQQTGYPFFKASRIRHILAQGFDVIHYHNISLVGGPKVLEPGRGIKLYTTHEYWLLCPTHVLFRFNRAPCTQRYCLLCGLFYKRPPQWWRYSRMLRSALKHVDAFLAPSRFCMDKHRELGLDLPFAHMPSFVPAPQTAPPTPTAALDGQVQKPYFLFVGRLEKLKGLHTLFPVFRRYPKAQLWIAGTGNDEPRLRQLAQGMANVRFLGYHSGERLQALFRSAAAVIVPSICFDVSPQVVMEAFRQCTPVIVRNLGGLPEMVEESGGGFVYGTEEELIAAMDPLLAHPSRRDELGSRGYQAFLRYWTPEAHLGRYLALIGTIARRKETELRR